MKNLSTFILLAATFFLFSFTKGDYERAMESAISEMNQAKGLDDLKSVANKFERIAAAEKKEWLPSYYSAYCYIMMTTLEKDLAKWDGYLDTADAILEKTTKHKKVDMVEVLALQGFGTMMRISVDPAARGQEYSMKSAAFLQQAHQLDNSNPRVNLMMAQMLYGTAQFFGKGTEKACQKFEEAKSRFEEEEKEGRGIEPKWGKPQVESMLQRCKKSSRDN